MSGVDRVLAIRRGQTAYDEELWRFMDRVIGPNLRNLEVAELQQRLDEIDRNIQYLDPGRTPRDGLPPERGWMSPWWWLRQRYWTTLEFDRRTLAPGGTPTVPPPLPVHPDLVGVMGGGRRQLVRIGSAKWLLPMLERGTLRFARASFYRQPSLGVARADDELAKSYRRPGQVINITTSDGRAIPALGDVQFTRRRAIEARAGLAEVEYWLCSFSSELDPRLFDEFGGPDPSDDACIIIHDPEAFVRQALKPLIALAPRAAKELFPVEYYDPWYPPAETLSPLRAKEHRYAFQQEMRFVLDPEAGPDLAAGDALFAEVGSLTAIAGLYDRDGRKIAGAGPATFLG